MLLTFNVFVGVQDCSSIVTVFSTGRDTIEEFPFRRKEHLPGLPGEARVSGRPALVACGGGNDGAVEEEARVLRAFGQRFGHFGARLRQAATGLKRPSQRVVVKTSMRAFNSPWASLRADSDPRLQF